MFLASPEPYIAFDAKPLAWLNLSHLEKASVFVIVRTSAMTVHTLALVHDNLPSGGFGLTNKRQPNKLQTDQRQNCKQNPQHGLRIQRNPEEALVRRIHLPRLRVRRLKHPPPVARLRVDFVPPAQPDESAAGNVLQIVEVDGEQQDGDDEDHDKVGGQEAQAEDVYEEGGYETSC